MAERVHLDEAARQSGKSEITIRRLIKAGKIPFAKETTLTGFVYLVDPEDVKSYYTSGKKGTGSEVKADQAKPVVEEIVAPEEQPKEQTEDKQEEPAVIEQPKPEQPEPVDAADKADVQEESAPKVEESVKPVEEVIEEKQPSPPTRVAVGNEVGGIGEYWRKRAAIYEQRLEQEVTEHEQTRQELEALKSAKGFRFAKEQPKAAVAAMEIVPTKETKEKLVKKDDEVGVGTLLFWVLGVILFLVIVGGIGYWFFVNLQ